MKTDTSQNQVLHLPRLLVLASTFPRWADDTEPSFILELCRRLCSEYEVHVLAPHSPGAAKFEILSGVTVHRFGYAPEQYQTLTYDGGILSRLKQNPWRVGLIPLFLGAEALAIRSLLKRFEFSAIHSHWIIPQTLSLRLGTLGLNKIPPVLCTSHGGDLFGLQGAVLSRLKRWSLACCDAVTVVSNAMVSEAIRLAPEIKPAVIPMGTCLTKRFIVDASVIREKRVVLFVGRLVEKKGVFYLLEAIARILPQYPELQLWIAGKGPDEEGLKNRAVQSDLAGHVNFLGGIPHADLPDLYRRASMTVVPSVVAEGGDQEGFGLVIVEAMGCGSPVIVSDLPAIQDIVPAEHLAQRVKPRDVSALAQAISDTLGNPHKALERADKALSHIKERFDWSHIAQEYSKILKTLKKSDVNHHE